MIVFLSTGKTYLRLPKKLACRECPNYVSSREKQLKFNLILRMKCNSIQEVQNKSEIMNEVCKLCHRHNLTVLSSLLVARYGADG